jgi:DNA-directed RNA polymerase specialized sigma24 family protein
MTIKGKPPEKHPRPARLPLDARRIELQEPWKKLVYRADYLMGGWDNVRGQTPDDLAQEALLTYCTELGGTYARDPYKVASTDLQRGLRDLWQKTDREVSGADWKTAGESDDPEDEDWESDLESNDLVARYFTPDTMDLLSSVLTARELEAVVHVYEEDLTREDAGELMGIKKSAVIRLVNRALDKIKESGVTFFGSRPF